MTKRDPWNDRHRSAVQDLAKTALRLGVRVACAESCTGGWLAKVLTDLPGSSEWFEGGVVSYSNRVKRELLGVDGELLTTHGAVSEAVARAMVEGLGRITAAQASVAITGIAGPDGGSSGKPVGCVWLSWGWVGQCVAAERYDFQGDRNTIRAQAVQSALSGLRNMMENRE